MLPREARFCYRCFGLAQDKLCQLAAPSAIQSGASSDQGTRIKVRPNVSYFSVGNAKALTEWKYCSFTSFEIG
jgi:hypothetical protein